ncbi:hypothetical protein SCP_0310150 [Sparassis crispa]|uniref:F-box domain-containing protein n=1 Tax=Sparassis crispa TaxID=139825 RepID=A0A401GGI8_9APHY|nr:hypothetical protein SCP_0310150 [Sparassis crispa]GBE81288.1 hypothetical protein SCP_0310150 [Sparassis crispa]
MSQLEVLPTELVLNILSYLPLQSLFSLQLTSHFWLSFIQANESTVYRQAALVHNYSASADASLPDAKATHLGDFVVDVHTWKLYCQRCLQTDRDWAGEGSATVTTYCRASCDIHRLKVDETEGFLITTHQNGGLQVTDLRTREVLWALSSTYVRPYAHCEYDNGFIIFDRFGAFKEVWRLVSSFDPTDAPTRSLPDEDQLNTSAEADTLYYSRTKRGHFKPWALLETPEQGRAFRFAYPTLAVVSYDAIYLWDITSATLVESIGDIQSLHGGSSALGDINYVDVSPRYVFSSSTNYAETQAVLDPPDPRLLESGSLPTVLPIAVHVSARHSTSQHDFTAGKFWLHVSSSGRDIAVLCSDNRLILIRDFERVTKGPVSIAEVALELHLRPSEAREDIGLHGSSYYSIYFAYWEGRIGIVTTSGVYILTLDATLHLLPSSEALPDVARTSLGIIQEHSSLGSNISFRHLSASYIPYFGNGGLLSQVSCLQMTETKLYFTWNSEDIPPEGSDHGKRMQPSENVEALWDTAAIEDEAGPSDLSAQTAAWMETNQHDTAMDDEFMSGGRGLNSFMVDGEWYNEDEDDYEDGDDYGEYDYDDYDEHHTDDWDEIHASSGPVVCCVDFSPLHD